MFSFDCAYTFLGTQADLEARQAEVKKLMSSESALGEMMRDKLVLTLDRVAKAVVVDME